MQIDRILVASDSYSGLDNALSKVALIEHITGASVEAATVVYDPIDEQPFPEREKARLVEAFMAAERAGLVGLLAPFEDKIAWADPRVLWGKRAETAIIKEALARKVDLIVKPMAESAGISDLLHTPLDWRLIRSSPIPVLISKSETWKSGDDVLVAVDASDPKHRDLNTKLLAAASAFARVLNGRLYLVSAYPDLGQSVNDYQVAIDYQGIKDDMRESYSTELARLVDEAGLERVECMVREGKPATVIDGLVRQIKPALVVLGTSAHGGVKKLLLGNTVEKILARLPADVLTIR